MPGRRRGITQGGRGGARGEERKVRGDQVDWVGREEYLRFHGPGGAAITAAVDTEEGRRGLHIVAPKF